MLLKKKNFYGIYFWIKFSRRFNFSLNRHDSDLEKKLNRHGVYFYPSLHKK